MSDRTPEYSKHLAKASNEPLNRVDKKGKPVLHSFQIIPPLEVNIII